MDAMDRMPGDAEARVAAEGMAELYGCELPTVGSTVRVRLRTHAENEFERATVIRHHHESGPFAIVVELEDEPGIRRAIDAREWPAGNVLPF